jgi:hypothetical protein
MAVFWAVAPCSPVEVYQRFRGPCCLHYQGDIGRKSVTLCLTYRGLIHNKKAFENNNNNNKFKYRNSANMEHEMFYHTSNHWSHRNCN